MARSGKPLLPEIAMTASCGLERAGRRVERGSRSRGSHDGRTEINLCDGVRKEVLEADVPSCNTFTCAENWWCSSAASLGRR